MDKVVYRYVGLGEILPGIPARDLTQADIDRLKKEGAAALADLEESAMYVAETKAKAGAATGEPRTAVDGDTLTED